MIVAEIEAFLSRPVAPTRRVALGRLRLPTEGAAEAAATLLGGVVAGFAADLDDDDVVELHRLLRDVELDRRIPQPRLRHRLQHDRVGLQRSVHRLVQDRGGWLHLDLDHQRGTPAQHVLVAVHAARRLDGRARVTALEGMRRGARWRGDLGPELIGALRSDGPRHRHGPAASSADPVAWALGVLGLSSVDGRPSSAQVRSAFRSSVRGAHPDHGAAAGEAAGRIAELDAARRILLGTA